MEFIINNSPELSMADITKLLFNLNFLSDVQFIVAGKTIYAHSMELMKRSVVFQKQLFATLGENKLIVIDDASYDNFHEFVRFIYTDECEINESNAIKLLKLARRYKVIKLENAAICFVNSDKNNLKLYEYCLLENDERYKRKSQLTVIRHFESVLLSDQFLKIHPIVIENILKSENANVSEERLFTALAQWITQNSTDNQIEAHQLRDQYDSLIHLIRFPLMADELFNCVAEYPYLFKASDFVSFFEEIAQKPDSKNKIWNAQKRTPLIYPYEYIDGNATETMFTVSRELLLVGLHFGGSIYETSANLQISQKNLDSKIIKTLKLICMRREDKSMYEVNLGESLRLQPNMLYMINVTYANNNRILSRKQNVDMFCNVASDLIQFEKVSRHIFEVYFELIE